MTPHISAQPQDFAKTVLMPGDPRRAKFIAENYLTDARLVTDVRGMLGYTGTYKGKPVSVMGSGMGMPSIGIYATELFKFYDVETIMRVGSCGAYQDDLKLYDIILAQGASTNGNFGAHFMPTGTFSALCDFELLYTAYNVGAKKGVKPHVGNVLSSDIFYHPIPDIWKSWSNLNVLAVEMETYALYTLAQSMGKKALSLLTVSDSLVTMEETSAKEREASFTAMMEIALETAYELQK
ncbi:purine-nucleoside phosphorylase [Peptoniphilus equinus]|uniref:Purine nucleoside phosphorylase DeoD-type n=1 Tax=Peptoniphilus equinus TaxID=3016343 RepID=A0ABY7QWE9_9FIRM|nr:purine-nucleoside phosphorylase [Peptoniphilus equinus]WBW50756.1 purine-nucleoside phosphorylase [Peptoniphilus equinus]